MGATEPQALAWGEAPLKYHPWRALALTPTPERGGGQRLVPIQPEGTFGRLRYPLGGDRPSQTARLARSRARMTGAG